MVKLATDRPFRLRRAFQTGRLRRIQLANGVRPIRNEIHERLCFASADSGATRRGRALADEWLRQETSLWTFVRRKGVSPTNKAAERALRHAEIWHKITCGARFSEGFRFVESILTILSTAKRRDLDPRTWLADAIRALRQGEGPPLLLPA